MGPAWTPLAVVVGVAAAILAGAGVVAVVAHEDDGDRPAAEAPAGRDIPGDTAGDGRPGDTAGDDIAGEGGAQDDSAPPTSTPGTSTTRAAGAGTSPPTTAARSPTTPAPTASPGTTTRPTTATTSAPDLCAVEQIELTLATGATSYPAGQPVTMTTSIRNRSSTPCSFRGFTVTMRFVDPEGRELFGSVAHADDVEYRQFVPGQRLTQSATWDPRACQAPPCAQPPPGIYAVAASWDFSGGRYAGTQQYVLR